MEQQNASRRRYLVQVTETVTTIGMVTVQACSQKEAELLAEEQFNRTFCDQRTCERETMVVEEHTTQVPCCEKTAAPKTAYRLMNDRRA